MLDTNVLVSAIIFPNRTFDRVIEDASSGGNELVLATYVRAYASMRPERYERTVPS